MFTLDSHLLHLYVHTYTLHNARLQITEGVERTVVSTEIMPLVVKLLRYTNVLRLTINNCKHVYKLQISERETINGVNYEGVAEFICLGALISNDNSVEKEIQRLFWPAIELILPP
jgi:hypothetical protein